ncbi:MAG TPA: YdiU family protein [Oligoflexia bacterium]|nr:YdiU family protein [Oligoflexia bacterium]HMP47666.1 YdiU family protein [Oligoflexia bacterium]
MTNTPLSDLSAKAFLNSFTESLPGDFDGLPNIPRQVPDVCFSISKPTPVKNPELISWSEDAGKLIGVSKPEKLSSGLNILSGNLVPESMKPFAARYGGHQFGVWAGQLGDGRAISLGQISGNKFYSDFYYGDSSPIIYPHDIRNYIPSSWELQLKGSGPTPYSRRAEGRAVLRSSLREFICSEAMYYLGIPTTRALSLVSTGEKVIRDMFYDGNPKEEQGAIVCRMAPSFIRFGNFEIHAINNEIKTLKLLADYTIRNFFPYLLDSTDNKLENLSVQIYSDWYKDVCTRTAFLVSHWMRTGFVHGVMNTDNMSILGLTIDYGPYGWLEEFDSEWTPNTTDAPTKRYCYGNQPDIALWNLIQLGNALYPIINDEKLVYDGLRLFESCYEKYQNQMMSEKLGFQNLDEQEDIKLLLKLPEVLNSCEIDFTIFFRKLSEISTNTSKEDAINLLDSSFYKFRDPEQKNLDQLLKWLEVYQSRIKFHYPEKGDIQRFQSMNIANPKYLFRNYLASIAIEKAEQGDYSEIEKLLSILKMPYDEQPENEQYAARRPEWARNKAGCSMLSCSS